MTVQTTFVGGLNPWAIYFKHGPERPVKKSNNRGNQLTINTSKLVMIDNKGKPIQLGKINRSKDFFDKMKPGFTLNFDPSDHQKMVYLFRMWRNRQKDELRAAKFVKDGQIGLFDPGAQG